MDGVHGWMFPTMTVEARIEKSAPPTSPSQVLLGLIVGASGVTPHPAPDDQRPDVVGHGGDDGPEQEGDAVAVGEHRRRQEQAGIGAEQRDPADGQHGRRRPGHRRSALDAEQVPEQRERGDQHQDQGHRGDPLVVGPDHQRDGADQAEQGGRVVADPPQHAEALAGREGDHHQAQDQGGDRAQLEGQRGRPRPRRCRFRPGCRSSCRGRRTSSPRHRTSRGWRLARGAGGGPPPVGASGPVGPPEAVDRPTRTSVSAGAGEPRRPRPRWRPDRHRPGPAGSSRWLCR